MSFAHIATRSIPTVSSRPRTRAISSFVPTPSVAAARSRPSPRSNRPANPPTPETTSGGAAVRARSRISATAAEAASRSTPASLYASTAALASLGAAGLALRRGLTELMRFERELGGRFLADRDGVLAVEARPAEAAGRRSRCLQESLERQIRQRVCLDEPPHLL